MTKAGATAIAAAVLFLGAAAAAGAQNRDGVYRGTLVCSALPFAKVQLRTAIEVTVIGTTAKYSQPVMIGDAEKPAGTETGSGSVEGDRLLLSGNWRGEKDGFDATYSGTFVRRSVRLTGSQTWAHDKQAYRRTCSGAIKRPFRFMQKPAA
jgi:hypothetical protein